MNNVKDLVRAAEVASTLGFAATSSVADASVIGPGREETAAVAYLVLAMLFVVLVGGMLMPLLIFVTRLTIGLAWALLKVGGHILRDEIVKWILLGAAGSLGLLKYLDWPYFN